MKRALSLLITAFIIFLAKGYSQTISFSGKNIQLTEVFSAIKSQAGYVFFYDAALLYDTKPVTIDLKNVSLEEALQQTLKDQPLGWLIEDKTITIIRKPLPVANRQETNILTVTGTVRDEEDKPIQGASVIMKGEGRGTQTNENGAFTILAKKGSVLLFSSSGYVEKQIKIEEKMLAIQLKLVVSELDKVQMIAYGTTTRRLSTGSISLVNLVYL